jgi:FkbM family methyltransferase
VCDTWPMVTTSVLNRLIRPPRTAWRLGRHRFRRALGLDPSHKVDLVCPTLYLGSDYGGWTIQPELLAATSVVYSLGVGRDVSFDLALVNRFGLTVHAFDPTPRSSAWVRSQQLPSAFICHEFGVAEFDGRATFYPPEREDHVSYSVVDGAVKNTAPVFGQVQRLDTTMRTLGHERIDLLKMDIEGSEYAVIDALVTTPVLVRQCLVEFHHRLPGIGAQRTHHAVQQLRQCGFKLPVSAWSGEEYSFLRD